MSSPEGFVATPETAEGLDTGYFLDTYGLGPAELNTVVSSDGHNGTVGEMLADPECPVGRWVAKSYTTGGLEGVEKKLTQLGEMSDGEFSVQISAQTRGYHSGTVDRKELLAKQPEHPDFLA